MYKRFHASIQEFIALNGGIILSSSLGHEHFDSTSKPCHVCGSSDFQWGMPIASPSEGDLAKVFIYLTYKLETGADAATPLEARLCKNCGNVLLFLIDK